MSEREFDIWVYDQLNPGDKLRVRYPRHRLSAWVEKMQMDLGYRPPVDEAEQTRKEDEYLKQFGI